MGLGIDPDPPFARTPEEAKERRLEERAWNATAKMHVPANPMLLRMVMDTLKDKPEVTANPDKGGPKITGTKDLGSE